MIDIAGQVLGRVLTGVCEIVVILLSFFPTASAWEVIVTINFCIFSSHRLRDLLKSFWCLSCSFLHFFLRWSHFFLRSFSPLSRSFLHSRRSVLRRSSFFKRYFLHSIYLSSTYRSILLHKQFMSQVICFKICCWLNLLCHCSFCS